MARLLSRQTVFFHEAGFKRMEPTQRARQIVVIVRVDGNDVSKQCINISLRNIWKPTCRIDDASLLRCGPLFGGFACRDIIGMHPVVDKYAFQHTSAAILQQAMPILEVRGAVIRAVEVNAAIFNDIGSKHC